MALVEWQGRLRVVEIVNGGQLLSHPLPLLYLSSPSVKKYVQHCPISNLHVLQSLARRNGADNIVEDHAVRRGALVTCSCSSA